MVPIEEFEASFQFMQECALFFWRLKTKISAWMNGHLVCALSWRKTELHRTVFQPLPTLGLLYSLVWIRFILLSIQRKFIFSVFLIHHLIGILKLLVRFPITALHSWGAQPLSNVRSMNGTSISTFRRIMWHLLVEWCPLPPIRFCVALHPTSA